MGTCPVLGCPRSWASSPPPTIKRTQSRTRGHRVCGRTPSPQRDASGGVGVGGAAGCARGGRVGGAVGARGTAGVDGGSVGGAVRVLAAMPLDGRTTTETLAFVSYRVAGERCWDIVSTPLTPAQLARGQDDVHPYPELSCRGDASCGDICLRLNLYTSVSSVASPWRALGGTVAARATGIRLLYADGTRTTYPLTGPIAAGFPRQRILILDRGHDQRRVTGAALLKDGRDEGRCRCGAGSPSRRPPSCPRSCRRSLSSRRAPSVNVSSAAESEVAPHGWIIETSVAWPRQLASCDVAGGRSDRPRPHVSAVSTVPA